MMISLVLRKPLEIFEIYFPVQQSSDFHKVSYFHFIYMKQFCANLNTAATLGENLSLLIDLFTY